VVKAVVQKVVPGGKHGPFAVATSEGLDSSVTFSLEPTIWQEKEWPEEGMYVLLGKLRQKRAGWRAKTGRFFKPSDEQTERSNEMEKINVTALNEQIAKSANKQRQEARTVQICFEYIGMGFTLYNSADAPEYKELEQKLKRIESALASSDDEARLKLTTELLKLWFTGSDDEVREVFGDCVKLRSVRKAMYTLTGQGRQLRVWYSFPGRIQYNHVDSCGESLLFGVYGHPDVVQRYLRAFLSIANLAEAYGKDGVRIFVGW
jgi:hypothetical protein